MALGQLHTPAVIDQPFELHVLRRGLEKVQHQRNCLLLFQLKAR